jgi:aspartate beta-hydroxylase
MAAPNDRINQLLGAAAAARKAGNHNSALEHLEAALKFAPEDPQVLNARGMQALAQNDTQDAVLWYSRAAQNDPKEPVLWMNVARAQREIQDDVGELNSLERALAADQQHFMAWLRKAQLHERRGELAPATHCWKVTLNMAAGLDPLPPGLGPVMAQARGFVASQSTAFAAAMETGLVTDRESLTVPERRRFDACLDVVLGRRTIYTNVCAGIHFPFLPAEEFFERHHFPWLGAIEAQTEIIQAEFLALIGNGNGGLRPYVQMDAGTPQNKWSALDGSLDWGAYFLTEYGIPNPVALEACPQTVAALAAVPCADIPGRAPTAFFSLLKPRTRIPPHTGVTNTRAIIHLPLVVPAGCGFRVGGTTRHWQVGEALAFDDTIEHEAWNDSDELRAVLIFDVWNPYLTDSECQLLRRFFSVADASGFDPQPRSHV